MDDLEEIRLRALARKRKAEGTPKGSLATAAAQGLSFGFSDEFSGAVGAPIKMLREGKSFGDAYAEGRDRSRAMLDEVRQRRPVASAVAEMGGAIAPVLATGGAGLLGKGLTTLGRMGRGAVEGGLLGSIYGAGSGEGGAAQRGVSAAKGAVAGSLGGAAVPAVGGALASRAARKAIPSTEALKDAGSALYQKAEQAGVTIKAPAFQRAIGNAKMAAGSINRDLRPKTAGIVQEFEDLAGKNVTLQELDELRQVVGKSMKRADPQDVRTLKRIQVTLDDFADKLKAGDITGDMKGVSYLKEARDLWSRKSKSEVVDRMFEKAKLDAPNFSGSGMENAMRTQFRQLAKNDKKMRMFTKAEQDAIKKVASGGPLENGLRTLGKLAPTGVVSAGIGSSVGYAIGGPAGAVALPMAGFAGRQAATAMTRRNLGRVSETIRSGGQSADEIARLARAGKGSPDQIAQQARIMELERRGLLPAAAGAAALGSR